MSQNLAVHFAMAECYLRGMGVERDVPEAVNLLMRAHNEGYAPAGEKLLEIKSIYDIAVGHKPDRVEARAIAERIGAHLKNHPDNPIIPVLSAT